MIGPSLPNAAAQFTIAPRGPFSLAAARAFWEEFTPAAYETQVSGDRFDFAVLADDGINAAGIRLVQRDNLIEGEIVGAADPTLVQAQVCRMLSLDVDGSDFPAVGKRDPVVGHLQARFPGMRPVCFASPYEAAAWAIIGHRIRIMQAAAIKRRLTAEHGPTVVLNDRVEAVFPGPKALHQIDQFPGLADRKILYLHALSEATLEGRLDPAHLRELPVEEARRQLKQLQGIGDFGADLILIRGTGTVDLLPMAEPRLGRAIAHAYQLSDSPSPEVIRTMAEAWRPFRTWVTVLLRTALEADTHEIRG